MQQIIIDGERLGNYAQVHGLGLDTPFLAISNDTAGWGAGRIVPDNVDEITLIVSDWTGTLITVEGFSGRYGQGNWKLHPGDRVRVRVWNPQTGAKADDCLVTVGGGDTVCSK